MKSNTKNHAHLKTLRRSQRHPRANSPARAQATAFAAAPSVKTLASPTDSLAAFAAELASLCGAASKQTEALTAARVRLDGLRAANSKQTEALTAARVRLDGLRAANSKQTEVITAAHVRLGGLIAQNNSLSDKLAARNAVVQRLLKMVNDGNLSVEEAFEKLHALPRLASAAGPENCASVLSFPLNAPPTGQGTPEPQRP